MNLTNQMEAALPNVVRVLRYYSLGVRCSVYRNHEGWTARMAVQNGGATLVVNGMLLRGDDATSPAAALSRLEQECEHVMRPLVELANG